MTKVFSKNQVSFIKKIIGIGIAVWVISSIFSIYWAVIIGVVDWFFGVLLKDRKSFLFEEF